VGHGDWVRPHITTPDCLAQKVPRIRSIQLILGHSDVKTTQRYLNVSDQELLRTMTGVWERRKLLRAVNG
jgi:integrase